MSVLKRLTIIITLIFTATTYKALLNTHVPTTIYYTRSTSSLSTSTATTSTPQQGNAGNDVFCIYYYSAWFIKRYRNPTWGR